MKRAILASILLIFLTAGLGSMLLVGVGSNPDSVSPTSPSTATCYYPGGSYPDLVPWDCYGSGTYLYTCGSTHRCGFDDWDMTLVKWDLNGNVLWNRSYSKTTSDFGESVWANTSSIFTLGYTQAPGGNLNLLLVKWDTAGNMLWNRTWGGSGEEIGYGVWGDNNYIYTCGSTGSYGADELDLVLIKWDGAGNIVWNQTWGGTGDDYGFDLFGDGTYIYTSGKSDSWSSYFDIALVKWYTNGSIVWSYTWGGPYEERGSSVGGNSTAIYVCGLTYPTYSGYSNLVLVKWASNGTRLWNRTWGGPYEDRAYKLWVDATAIYTCGWTQSYSYGHLDLSLIKWDPNGNRLWNKTWNGDMLPYPEYPVDCCYNGNINVRGMGVWGSGTSIYTCGYVVGYPPHYSDVVLAKWDTQGYLYWEELWGTPCDAWECNNTPPYEPIFVVVVTVIAVVVVGLVLGLTYHARVSRRAPPRERVPAQSLPRERVTEQPLPRSMERPTSSQEATVTPAQPRRVETPSYSASAIRRYCYNCGAEHPADADFCMYCGAQLKDGK